MNKILLLGILLLASLLFVWTATNQKPGDIPLPTYPLTEKPASTPTLPHSPASRLVKPSPTGGSIIPQSMLQVVPFTSQAPLAEWNDPLQQDGCEEASSLMAVMWARNQKLESSEEYKDKILDISHWQLEEYGIAKDSSAEDTVERIFKGFFKYYNVNTKTIQSFQEIIDTLAKGHLVVIPANGQIIGNPHYAQPGPERHMIVIKGYDLKTSEFITNDPGTRSGNGYRYSFQKLYDGIHDYPTGDHQPIVSKNKVIIIVEKEDHESDN